MSKKNIIPLFLFCVFIIPIVDLFHWGLPITHDGQDHIARIANFFTNLQFGNVIPRWAPNLNWGYGHPVLEFLYPLPSYIASLFHFLGFSFIDSAKIVYGFGMVFSGIAMYFWISSFWGKKAGIVASLMYVFAPYRFVELYVRGDIGENLAFIFVPLVFLFIHKISIKETKLQVALGAISLSCLILSHNAMSLMFLPLLLIYIFYKFFYHVDNKKSFLISCVTLFVLGFGIAAFFWVPALFESKFTLRNIVTAGVYKNRFVTLGQLAYGPWSYGGTGQFTVQIGIVQLIAFCFSLLAIPYFYISKNKKLPFTIIFVLYTIVAIFLMTNGSQIVWEHIMLLQNFQFPWRFLAVTVFTTSVLGALFIAWLAEKAKMAFAGIIFVALIFLHINYWHANGYFYKPDSFFTSLYSGTTDTGESSPIWSVRFMEKKPKAVIELVSGKAVVVQAKRTPTSHVYSINASTPLLLLENTLYFPGWSVAVDGKKVPIEFQNPVYRGLMTFSVPSGEHQVVVSFSETKLRLFSDIVSVCSIVALFGLFVKNKFL